MWTSWLLLLTVSAVAQAAIDKDLVTNLPGLTFEPKFKHYSGYLQATGTRQFHYWFVESQRDPANDPVVLWLNGGPGCSSLDGMLSEHGPFKVSDDGKTIKENPFAWNLVANVLYLESPAGVGYSYASDKNYTTGDDDTSLDNLWAVKYFLSHFPEYAGNEFFVTGESYGGFYVPLLANRLLTEHNINLKGYAVGNGLSDRELNSDSVFYFAYYHGLFGSAAYNDLLTYCCKGNCSGVCPIIQSAYKGRCGDVVSKIMHLVGDPNINIYNIYGKCYHGKINPTGTPSLYHPFNVLMSKSMPTPEVKAKALMARHNFTTVPPCINADGMTWYLNDKAVRQALHIPDFLPDWEICSSRVIYHSEYQTMKQQYLNVLRTKKYRVMLYNGDFDMACNFFGDEKFVNSLGQKATADRRIWSYQAADGSTQVGGFVHEFENLWFTTVKGAGHMVPQDKPAPALHIFRRFLSGTPL